MISALESLRALGKHAVLGTSHYAGANRLLRNAHRKHLLIVLYHGVITAPRDPLGYTVHVSDFEQQIATLAKWFRPITLKQLVAAIDRKEPLKERSVLVTFDDGYRNNLTLAAPILRRYGVPAVVHLVTGYIGSKRILWVEEIRLRIQHCRAAQVPMPAGETDQPLPAAPTARAALALRVSALCKNLAESEKQEYLDRLRQVPAAFGETCSDEVFGFLSWDEVRQWQAQGFEVGAHTVNHPILSALDPPSLEAELTESKRAIEEQLGGECAAFAYPNGRRRDISDAAIQAVRQAGYKVAFLGMDRFNRDLSSPLTLTRMNMIGYMPRTVFHSRISGLVELAH